MVYGFVPSYYFLITERGNKYDTSNNEIDQYVFNYYPGI